MKIGPKPIGSFLIVALICGIVDGIGWFGVGWLRQTCAIMDTPVIDLTVDSTDM